MSLFKCEQCGAVENTATSGYWHASCERHRGNADVKLLCSECDPEIGRWHGIFPKRNATAEGYMLGNDGYLYSKSHVESGDLKWREEHQGFRIVGPA